MRTSAIEYPNYAAEIEEIELNGITQDLITRIISRHQGNAKHTKGLYGRYRINSDDVPVFGRIPRFKDDGISAINNKINNDFFSEIIDIKVGYFSGKPANYTYGNDYLSLEETGGEEAVQIAVKTLNDFVKRNNMFDIDMETTKFASICGYSGRLFYIDKEGKERVMVLPAYETIILYRSEMTDPIYAIRYYEYMDLNDHKIIKVEFYDDKNIIYYEGQIGSFNHIETRQHMFNYCPLQGIPNNKELMGDAEKVISLIDDYDSAYSDNSNDIEGFANAYMVFKNSKVDESTMELANATGVIGIEPEDPQSPYDVSYLTKNIDGTFVSGHLDRAEDNIYRFTKTPNLNDPEFNAVSGIALKIKMTGLETKTGSFEAKQVSAATYMFKLLASSFIKKKIAFEPLQCSVKYNRNFPVDFVGEAQAVQALIAAGLPQQVAFKALSFVDDIDYIMRLIEEEKDDMPNLNKPEEGNNAGFGRTANDESRDRVEQEKIGRNGDLPDLSETIREA